MNTKRLGQELTILQSNVIGLFRRHTSKQVDMVISDGKEGLLAVSVTTLGGLSVYPITLDKGILKLFDNGKTLFDIKGSEHQSELNDAMNTILGKKEKMFKINENDKRHLSEIYNTMKEQHNENSEYMQEFKRILELTPKGVSPKILTEDGQ